jgi:hypothetical protein
LGGLCTTNADCCVGTLCQVPPGSLAGICTIPTPPPGADAGVPVPGPDSGVPGADTGPGPDTATGPEPDSGLPGSDTAVPEPDLAPPICAYFGQTCSLTIPCCVGSSCVNNQFLPCTGTDTDCVCFVGE